MTIVVHRKAPPLPFVPTELHGKPVVVVACCWAGDIEEGERFLRPLKAFGSPVLDACVPKPFMTHQAMFDPSFPAGRWYYFKSCDVPELNDEIIDITVEHSLQISSPLTAFPIWQMGGAMSRWATTRPRSTAARPASRSTSVPVRRRVRDSRRSASGYETSGPHCNRGTRAFM